MYDDYDGSSSSSDVTIKADDAEDWWNTEIAHSEFNPDRFAFFDFKNTGVGVYKVPIV